MYPDTMHSEAAPRNREWSSGLFDIFNDGETCCMTFWCPCITFGRTAEIVDQGATSCGTSAALFALIEVLSGAYLTWAYSCTYRGRLRAQHGLLEAPCADFIVHFCCLPCALCQEYRELKARGYEPVLGWEGNAAAMSAPPAQGMGR